MLESWVAWVVNSYVGEYVGLEYLNTDQLSVALVHGSVVLENLPLRKDALRKLDLPIEVKSGFIGQLTIRIPVTNLRNAPWEIQIKKLYLVAGAQPNPQYDEEEAKSTDLQNKKKQLAALEEQWKAQHQQQSYSFWYSLGSSLLTKAITNIQINIEDVHFRYEDHTSLPGTTFALGITMDKFSLTSTDQKWTQKYPTKETPDVVRKLGKMEGFAVYWDTDAQPLGDVTPTQLQEELQKARTKAETPDAHSYIICPVSAEARVWQNHSPLPLRSRAMPRFQCELQLDDLPISLSQTQFKCMMGLLREFDRYSLARKYRKGRPNEPVLGNCRQWWQFAIQCHLQGVQQRHHRASWQYVLQRARENVQYVNLYSQHLTTPQALSEENKATMDRIESELSIDELRILVEVAMERCQGQVTVQGLPQTDSQSTAVTSPGNDQQPADTWGYMSSWFPGWAQWYTSPQGQTVQEDIRKQVSQETEPTIDEEEILALVVDSAADNTLLRRDLVFARLDFCLKNGSVTLLQTISDAEGQKVKPILEVSCSSISLGMELRPRFSSNLLTISLGALRVQDRTTEDTIFPSLLAPQCAESQVVPRQFGVYSRTGPSSYFQQSVPKPSSDDPLFNLIYEQKPLKSQADHRLEVTSRAMVIVYNSTAMHKIAEFFRSPHKSPGLRSQPSETQLTQLAALARTRYEQLKTQTQAEIRQTLDQLLEGESQGRSAVWDVRLDISAPQFLVPQSFTDKNATMVVFDFGHLSFSNQKDKSDEQKDTEESDIDEEDFVTPMSTPAATPPSEPVTLEKFVSVQQEMSAEELSEQALHEKLYERYKVGFSDLQVMVVKARDNWRHAHSKGTSHMHVIDRFSIGLRMERRLVFTSDPQWPSLTLAGNLPKLGLHVSEQKVHALLACMKALGGDEPSTPSPDLDPGDLPSDLSTASTLQATLDLSKSPSRVDKTGSEVMREILEESRLLLTEFSVDSMSVDVQSRSRSVAELQVSAVQACITKRPYDTSMTLTVHSLLLVDALQTFGPDFELLVASHKDLCMDVHGGSMVDSDYASSPRDTASTQGADRTTPRSVTSETASPPSSLGTNTPDVTAEPPFDLSTSAHSDTDALITMEFTQISPDCPTLVNGNGGPRQIASLQFNTLDVIANPETVMELLGFFQRVVPKDRGADTKPIPEDSVWLDDPGSNPPSDLLSSKTQITADFNRLNVLVLRAVPSGHRNVGYKVATATMSGAHVMTTLGGEKEMEVEGSLDGLQFLDLTPEGSRHKKVFTMGHDPTSQQLGIPDRGQEAGMDSTMFTTACGSSVFQDFTTNKPKALHFTLTPSTPQPLTPPLSTSTPGPAAVPEHLPADDSSLRLQLRLASACYTHSPRLLQDLSLCADQFTQYTATWANSLRSAASEMALSFVKKSDPLSMSVGPTSLWDSSKRLSRAGSYRGLNRADSLQQINRDQRSGLLKMDSLDVFDDLMGEAEAPARRLELDVVLQTPIVVLPRSQHSEDLMVAHLGQISIHNTRSALSDLSTPGKVDGTAEHFHVEIRDMNMYSLNHEQQNRSRASSATSINLSSVQESSSADCSQYMTDCGTPILHNTTLQLSLVKDTVAKPVAGGADALHRAEPASSDTTLTEEEQNPCLKISGKLVSPLKLVLSKSVYEQVMETVDNLTASNASGKPGEPQPQEKRQEEVVEDDGETKPPTSVSALKLEEPLFQRERMGSAAENSEDGDAPMVIHGSFDMPEFTVQLSGDLSEGEQGLVDLLFQNLKATYVKDNPHTTSIKISLRGLLMEDLLQSTDSKHRQLMVSYPKRRSKRQSVNRGQTVYISTSLPTHPHLLEHVHMPPSLPAILDSNLREYVEVPSYPATPPPSPQRTRSQEDVTEEETEESLVYINILLVDKNSPEFTTKYNRINRFVDVDFSCLDTTINLQTWVVLLDFFGIGSPKEPAPNPPAAGPGETQPAEGNAASPDAPEQVNTEVEVKVRSLSLLLNKPEYELAKANVAQLSARVSLVDGNMAVTGNLGSMSVLDLTPHGALYRERFVTSGKEALDFNIFRYGLPDPHLQRDYDIRVRLRMSSVRYVLTQRFQAETVAFCQHFKHLQDLLGTMRAATAGQKVSEAPGHAARILMDISAGAPVILFPQSSRSHNILVMNLGHLTVSNQFLFAGDRGTIQGDKQRDSASQAPQPGEDPSHSASPGDTLVYTVQDGVLGTLSTPEVSPAHRCLLDCMEVELLQMDLYSAERVDWHRSGTDAEDTLMFPSFMVQRKGGHPLQERCVLKLRVERNLDGEISHDVPDFNVLGMLSSVFCSLDLNQYQLVRGVLHCNLGEPLEEFERPPTATQEPSIQTVLSGNVWTGMSIHVDLVNVSMELLHSHAEKDKPAQSLARFEFIRSRLSYESFSDQSKDVDLVSHAIVAHDTRFKDQPANLRPNVFEEVLEPSSQYHQQGALQMELHYRSTKDFTRFTILLNNMRLMVIFDWLTAVKDFLLTDHQEEEQGEEPHPSDDFNPPEPQPQPVNVTQGVVTRRGPPPKPEPSMMEIKLNVTQTEFVVLESTASWDTNAIILKSTAVLTYRPQMIARPVSCSLQSLEVFSCQLGNEQDTALSIIDPLTVNIELKPSANQPQAAGLLDATVLPDLPPMLEVAFHTLNIRVSYHDIRLFLAIVNSLPKQTSSTANPNGAAAIPEKEKGPTAVSRGAGRGDGRRNNRQVKGPMEEIDMVQKLQELGFAAEDCRRALQQCEGRLNMAATWLLENAEPVPQKRRAASGDRQEGEEGGMRLSGVMVTANCACLCLIDDCKDSDVPLAEVALHDLMFVQYLEGVVKGSLNCALTVDYYNRELSGWEPLVEPWNCWFFWSNEFGSDEETTRSQFGWSQQPESDVQPSAMQVRITAEDRLDLNITSSFLDLYLSTQKNWTEDYLSGQTVSGAAPVRRRSPFVPYMLRNHTGCQLSFATQTTSSSRAETIGAQGRNPSKDSLLSDWHRVLPGENVPFEFEGRGKLRHRHTHELRVHQLVVQVEGWHQVSPVSVDRVGVYFRDAQPLRAKAETIFHDLPPARIVFAVTMEGSAQKVVTVRSALVIRSMLEVPAELKLESSSKPDGPVLLPVLEPYSSVPIPLDRVDWRLYARPRGWGVQFCQKDLAWMMVTKGGERKDSMRECSAGDETGTYRFCVSVRREHFPPDVACLLQPGPGASQRNVDIVRRPGHVIRLLPPVVVTNLLPTELSYYLKGTVINGKVKAGKSSALYSVDTTQTLELGVLLESFTECRELVIPLSGNTCIDHKVKLRLFDTRNRQLHLYVRLKATPGGTLRILISAPYWLINKTGLPLIFKQESVRGEAAGQFEEHELARSLAPLLFSYTDKDNPDMCTMRLGTAVHLDGMSSWCQRLSLEGGTGVRQLYVVRHGGHPSIVYNIGVDIRRGRGRYHATRIVTFAPRYILDNRTEHKLAFAQRHLARGMRTLNPEGYLSALPKANVLFHWPRVDLDMLLCVRITDVQDCSWSGGFSIERIGSFHVNMRGNNCRCIFLHVEIVQHGATFCVVFTDPTGLPPPYRIDNHAEVPVVFWQKDSVDDSLRTELKRHTSMAYARDELTLPSVLVCQVKGGSYAYFNMNRFGDGDQLCYENFIYIAFTETFRCRQDADQWADNGACRELVLDVPSGNAVVLRKKELGKRSQLWRMTSAGLLRHEGSSPPRHPGSSTAPSKALDGLVLDISDIAANPLKFITLCLRKPDQRRKATQTWNFTEDGRLCCLLGGLCVQAKDGTVGLRHSATAVLGPVGITQPGHIPPQQRVTRQKVQPGSGVLACRVMSDGPTRVLQITDIMQKRLQQSTVEDWVVVQDQTKPRPLATSHPQPAPPTPSSRDLELEVMLKGGVGISLVNRTPEELAFISLCGISVSYSATASRESLLATVNKIQVDNQLSGSCWPVMVYMAQRGPGPGREHPAVHMAVEKEPSTRQDTEIYKHLMLTVSPLVLQLEESGLLKLLQFFGFGASATELENVDVAEFDSWRNHTAATTAKRYYFETLKLYSTEMKLSVNRGAKLPPNLKALKAWLGLTLISFQEATVDLDAFTCLHAFETQQFLIDCIYRHYIEELKGQAAKILGSVDFLGNPIGLFNDVTDGLSGLVQHGNVSGLFRNVTHGLSNSAAKMTSALSDGLGTIALDPQHQQTRTQIRQHGGSGSEHIVAGLKGLGFGIVGGLTSLVTQTAEGAVKGGVEGFFSGLGKGLVGTVTRPATGLLDFASGTALAVRDTAASDDASRLLPRRVRLPRCCSGPGGTLPRFTEFHAQGQDYLYRLNDMNTTEMFISLEQLRKSDRDFLQGLVSSEAVYFLGRGGPDPEAIILQVNYSDLYHCIAITRNSDSTGEEKHYVEVTMKADNLAGVPTPSQNPQKRPVVRCDSKDIAQKVVKQIMYAKSLYDEHRLTLPPSKEEDPLDWDY